MEEFSVIIPVRQFAHCCITGNTVVGTNAFGGGICYSGGGPTIRQCIISNNQAAIIPWSDYPSIWSIGGGGIYGNGEGTIIDCYITKNTSYASGGGIYCSGTEVINCTISNNSACRNGGGIYCFNSNVLNCTINENEVSNIGNLVFSAFGGGINCYRNFVISGCLIKNNKAIAGGIPKLEGERACSAFGGGIWANGSGSSSEPLITNCIISENSAEGGKGEGTKGSAVIKIFFGPGGDGLGGGIYYVVFTATNQIAAYMLQNTVDICANWLLNVPAPNVSIGLKCVPYKIEMVVRGNLTGHAWRTYSAGQKYLCGVEMPEGLKENDYFPAPIITPSTKAAEGHDEDISKEEIIAQKNCL